MLAAVGGQIAAVQAVLDTGQAQLEATDEDGRTAFLLACHVGNAEVVALLARAGDNVTAKSKGACTALMEASSRGRWGGGGKAVQPAQWQQASGDVHKPRRRATNQRPNNRWVGF